MEIRILSSMAKVFHQGVPGRYADHGAFEGLTGESVTFQAAFRSDGADNGMARLSWDGAPGGEAYLVREVPVLKPAGRARDDDYLSLEPGLYPDLLERLPQNGFIRVSESWRSVFFVFDGLAPGEYTLNIQFTGVEGEPLARTTVTLRCLDVALPPQTLKYTRWFHADSLAAYYGVPVFSEAHWDIIRKFLKATVRQGMNTVLTPIHTPPLDTAVGTERATVQLIGVSLQGGKYIFDFSLLDRWVDLCESVGIRFFEMAHLYTQWGALAAPKIMADVNGGQVRIFGWDTPATGEEYAGFLAAYLPALVRHLRARGVLDRCLFHISDEPSERDSSQYLAARKQAGQHLEGCTLMDAASHLSLYRDGVVTNPIPANDAVDEFIKAGVPDLWTYYCCGQAEGVSNSFIAMPGERTRILGVQMYRHGIKGFLQWGLNHYFSELSLVRVNPFLTTDGDGCWPAGDPFNLYPGPGGEPMESLRSMQMRAALADMRALELLESLTGREHVQELIDGLAEYEVTFRHYPRGERYILDLRERVSREITDGLTSRITDPHA